MQAATRMADGQWPWRDFGWAYGPGEPLFVMLANELFGDVAAVVAVPARRGRRHRRGADLGAGARAPSGAGRSRRGPPPRSRPRSRSAPTRPPRRWRSRSAPSCSRRAAAPGWAGAAAAGAAFLRPDVGVLAALAAATMLAIGSPRSRARPGPRIARRRAARGRGRSRPAPPALMCLLVAALAGAGALPPVHRRGRPRARCGTRSWSRPAATGRGGGCRSRPGSTAATSRTSRRG